jgi:hypothetical protein
MRWVYFLFILFILMAIGLSMISCTNKMNFVCNDLFDSTLTMSEQADILKKCSEGQLTWRKKF